MILGGGGQQGKIRKPRVLVYMSASGKHEYMTLILVSVVCSITYTPYSMYLRGTIAVSFFMSIVHMQPSYDSSALSSSGTSLPSCQNMIYRNTINCRTAGAHKAETKLLAPSADASDGILAPHFRLFGLVLAIIINITFLTTTVTTVLLLLFLLLSLLLFNSHWQLWLEMFVHVPCQKLDSLRRFLQATALAVSDCISLFPFLPDSRHLQTFSSAGLGLATGKPLSFPLPARAMDSEASTCSTDSMSEEDSLKATVLL